MIKVTFSLQDNFYSSIKKSAITKGITFSRELRFIIENGLKNQDISTLKAMQNDLDKLAKLVEHSAVLTQELTYLTRYSVRKLPEDSNEYHTENLAIFRQKAKETVENLVKTIL